MAVGYNALTANTTGYDNVAVGYAALATNTTGSSNTAFGTDALTANTTGYENTGLGKSAGDSITTGVKNTLVGNAAGWSITDGQNNTAVGADALKTNVSGSQNTAFGYDALRDTTGSYNIGVGPGAGKNLTSGSQNIIVGHDVDAPDPEADDQLNIGDTIYGDLSAGIVSLGSSATEASAVLALTTTARGFLPPRVTTTERDAIGTPATGLLVYNTTASALQFYNGSAWTSVGAGGGGSTAIDDLTDAETDYATDFNMFLGSGSGATIASGGQYNLGLGQNSLNALTTGDNNLAFGHAALDVVTTGGQNIAIGRNALGATTTGTDNVAIGHQALLVNTTGQYNIAIGSNALDTATTAANNIAIGTDALGSTTTGANNVAVGVGALDTATTAANSTAIGYNALAAVTTGTQNIAVGYQAGDNITTGSSNIVIGYDIDAPSATASNQLNIGNTIYGDTSSGILSLGSSTTVSSAILALTTTARGFLPPRVTTTQRDAISSPVEGLVVYNTTTDAIDFYNGSAWVAGTGTGSITADSLDFTEFKDNMRLDASTDIRADGTNVLSITNTGTGNSFVVNDASGDTTPFVIDENGFVGIGEPDPDWPVHILAGLAPADDNANVNVETYVEGTSGSFNGSHGVRSFMTASTTGAGDVWATAFTASATAAADAKGQSVFAYDSYVETHAGDSGYGLMVRNGLDGTSTGGTMYGVYLDLDDTDVTNYGIYQATDNINYFAGRIGVGTNSPNASAILELSTTQRGFLPPRVTTTQRDAISTPAEGLFVYNSTSGALNFYDGSVWIEVADGAALVSELDDLSDVITEYANDNMFLGSGSGASIAAGAANVALGEDSLAATTSGSSNTAVGNNALQANTAGNNNVAIGADALDSSTTASGNTAVGYGALTANTSGTENAALGDRALAANTTGTGNTGLGSNAMQFTTTGGYNTAVGGDALQTNTVGNYNVALGYDALYAATTASNNTGLGTYALTAVTTGANNIAVGYQAGDNITTGSQNVIIGYGVDAPSATADGQLVIANFIYGTTLTGTGTTISSAGRVGFGDSSPDHTIDVQGNIGLMASGYISFGDTDGEPGYGIRDNAGTLECKNSGGAWGDCQDGTGAEDLDDLTDAETDYASAHNMFLGDGSGAAIAAGTYNIGLGEDALLSVTSGNYNIAVGYGALDAATTGSTNIAMGRNALGATTTGTDNIAIGDQALLVNTTGQYNVAIGSGALDTSTTASGNTGLGYNALTAVTTGAGNIAVGYLAGDNITTGSSNIIIGYNIDAPVATASNQLNIGNTIYGDTSTGGVSLGATTTTASAILALTSTTRGFLPPQVTTTQRDAISSPATGLVVYNTTTNEVNVYNGSAWASIGGTGSITADSLDFTEFKDAMTLDASTDIAASGTNVLSITNTGTGNSFVVNDAASDTTPFVVDASGNVAIGTTSVAASALLEMVSTSKGFLPPRMDTSARDLIGTPATGLVIFNTTSSKLEFYDGDSWEAVGTGAGGAIALDDLSDVETDYATQHNMFLGQGAIASIGGGGWYNLALGENALGSLTTGDRNTALGYAALAANEDGADNTAIGAGALDVNASGANNTAVGSGALGANDGCCNTAVGKDAMADNTTGYDNTAVGFEALRNVDTGTDNVAVGDEAGHSITEGVANVALGTGALHGATTGDGNIGLGPGAGDNITEGSGNIMIGAVAAPSATASNQLNIGNTIYGDVSSSILSLGSSTTVSSAILALTTTARGFLPPRVTTTQRDAISSPVEGLVVYNTTTDAIDFYNGSSWVAGTGSGSLTADSLDFTEFKDAMTLDASTDIAASGTNVLSITNTGTGNSFVVNDAASDTTPFVVDASGNVAIGTTTSSVPLTIQASNAVGLKIQTASTNQLNNIVFAESNGAGRIAIQKEMDNDFGVWMGAGSAGSESWWNPFAITTQGLVGIRTSEPAAHLHVVHEDGREGLMITSDSQPDGLSLSAYAAGVWIWNYAATPVTFGVGATEAMVMASDGDIGIGTSTPQSALHVPDGKYAQFQDNSPGAPPAGDCDSDAERGRLSIDTSNNRLYVCNGAARGWDYMALTD